MPHKCVKCSKVYDNNSPQLLRGCECGNRVFLFLKPEQMSLRELYDAGLDVVIDSKRIIELSRDKPVSIELDLPEFPQKQPESPKPAMSSITINNAGNYAGPAAPVVPKQDAGEDFGQNETKRAQRGLSGGPEVENIRVLEKGSYELDLESLMKGDPLVVRSQGGIYYVKIQAFKNAGKPNKA